MVTLEVKMAAERLAFFAVAIIGIAFSGVSSGVSRLVPMQKYQVDLDTKPSERWLPILEDFKTSAPLVVQYFNSLVSTYWIRERTHTYMYP